MWMQMDLPVRLHERRYSGVVPYSEKDGIQIKPMSTECPLKPVYYWELDLKMQISQIKGLIRKIQPESAVYVACIEFRNTAVFTIIVEY